MTILERKVNAIARYILAKNEQDEATACKELDLLMSGKLPVGTVREEIDALLTDLGVHAKLIGYEQVHEAIYLCIVQKDIIRAIVKELYPKVAEICGTTASRAERAIRHAVDVCFDRCDAEHLQSYFGYCINPIKGKLTNGEFIARCANIIRERIGGG